MALETDVLDKASWLTDEGQRLGFKVDSDEADVVWRLRGEPLFSFSFDAEGGDRAFQQAKRLYWLSNDYYSSIPWSHYIYLLGEIDASVYSMLQSLCHQYRIQIFTDWVELQAELSNDLEYYVETLTEFIEPAQSIDENILKIKESVEKWRTEKGALSYSYRGGFEGDLEAFASDLTGVLEVTSKTVPASFFLYNSCQVTEGLLLRLISVEGQRFVLSTEHRILPFTYEFVLDLSEKTAELNLGFQTEWAFIRHAIRYHELVEQLQRNDQVVLLNTETNETIIKITSQ